MFQRPEHHPCSSWWKDKIYVYVLSPEAVNPVVHVFNQGIGTALIVRYAPTTSSKMLENISFLSSIIARSKESRMSISPANRWLSKKITKGRK